MKTLPFLPWRRPGVESGPIRLTARRLYILPTRQGLVFAALLVGLLVGSANYGVALGYLFTFLLAGLGTVAMFHTQRNLAGLELRAGASQPVHAGDTAVFRLEAAVRDGRDRYALMLAHPEGMAPPLDLPADTPGHFRLALQRPRRGYHPVGRLTLSSTYPLGLFRCWTVFELTWGGLVYPAPAAQALPLPAPSGAGTGGGRRRGEEEYDGLRPYHPGDPLSRVAWKSAAREQGLLSKQFSGQAAGVLWLDWSDTPGADPEARLSRLTRWALDAEAAGLDWGLALPTRRIPPGRGEAHLRHGLEALALFGQPT